MSDQFSKDNFWLEHALQLARRAEADEEVPVGAVLVQDDEIIGEGWNCPISHSDPTAHAEVMALRQAAIRIKNYRLLDTTLYVTLEPCAMCTGAMVHARVRRLVFGAFDPRAGAVGSVCNILQIPTLNHSIEYVGGVLSEECGALLRDFFQRRR